jgi:hypothetical protein
MPYPLSQLKAKFLRVEREGDDTIYRTVKTLARAQGVQFLCPLCFRQNGEQMKGVHSVICWSRSRGAPDDVGPGPGRWTLEGTGLKDLTLNGDPPGGARSVWLTSGCGWHGFVTNGKASVTTSEAD